MSASHRHTFDMIPWLVTGRVEESERRKLDEHLRDCAECREEFSQQRLLRAAISNDQPRVDYAAGASLQKLWSRIGTEDPSDQNEEPTTFMTRAGTGNRQRAMQWLIAAVVVEAIGLTLLAGASLHRSSVVAAVQPAYRTVTTTEIVPASAALRIVFAPNLSINDMNGLLRENHLEIVNGPTAAGVYTLATTEPTQDLAQVLDTLRARTGVRFAEPIVGVEHAR
jgi:hypothetical protein